MQDIILMDENCLIMFLYSLAKTKAQIKIYYDKFRSRLLIK